MRQQSGTALRIVLRRLVSEHDMLIPRKQASPLLIVALLASSNLLLAQEGVRGPSAAAAVSGLRPSQTIRATAGERRVEGRVVESSAGLLAVEQDGARTELSVAALDSLWTRHRSAGRGAIIGGLVGGFLGGASLLYLVRGLCDTADRCRDDYVPAALIGGVIGGAGGLVVGAGIGALVFHWERRLP